MDFTHLHNFAAPVDVVAALLANPEFAHARGQSLDGASADAIVDGSVEDGFSISIRRTVPAASIPAEFRSFVGSDLDVRYTEAWEPADGDARDGTFAVEILGSPGHANGNLRIQAEGDITRFAAVGTVEVRVPLVGPMIERAVAGAVVKGLQAELAVADEWLTRG